MSARALLAHRPRGGARRPGSSDFSTVSFIPQPSCRDSLRLRLNLNHRNLTFLQRALERTCSGLVCIITAGVPWPLNARETSMAALNRELQITARAAVSIAGNKAAQIESRPAFVTHT